MKGSAGELALAAQLSEYPGWVREYRFAPDRKWQFDFAHPGLKLAIEIDGGAGHQGHGVIWRRERDYEKRDEAVARGWRVLVGSTRQAEDGTLLNFVRKCQGDYEHERST